MTIEISALGLIVSGTASIIAIGLGFLTARKHVEDWIQAALSKDEIIQKISLLVKPDMVFNEKGSIISDRGVSSLIQPEGITTKYGDDSIPCEITISFLKSMKIPPLLTPLNPDGIFITTKRGKSHDWIYSLDYNMTMAPDDDNYLRLFRLEIL